MITCQRIIIIVFFSRPPCNYTRGHQLKLFKNSRRKKTWKNSFSWRMMTRWNSLPSAMVESMTINQFKSNLEKCWEDSPLEYNPTANHNQSMRTIGTTVINRLKNRGSSSTLTKFNDYITIPNDSSMSWCLLCTPKPLDGIS